MQSGWTAVLMEATNRGLDGVLAAGAAGQQLKLDEVRELPLIHVPSDFALAVGGVVGSWCATAHATRDHGRNRSNMTLGRAQSRIEADLPADRAYSLLPNCLGRCSFCAPETCPLWVERS
jgi:hypothetical protein